MEERRSRIVLGLDPDLARLWPIAVERARARPESLPARDLGPDEPGSLDRAAVQVATARAVDLHCQAAIEAAGDECVAVKLQVACFERFGGFAGLRKVAEFAAGGGCS